MKDLSNFKGSLVNTYLHLWKYIKALKRHRGKFRALCTLRRLAMHNVDKCLSTAYNNRGDLSPRSLPV